MDNILKIVCKKDFLSFKEGFEIEIGDVTFLIGENGSGKSTILNKIASLYCKKELNRNLFNSLTEFSDNFEIITDDSKKYNKVKYFHFQFDDLRFRPDFDFDNIGLQINSSRKSSGESIFFQSLNILGFNDLEKNVLYVLDEPERGMSIKNQIKWKNIITNMVIKFNCKFIIATHSFVLPTVDDYDSLFKTNIYDLSSQSLTNSKEILKQIIK